jgi:hypothetical protein
MPGWPEAVSICMGSSPSCRLGPRSAARICVHPGLSVASGFTIYDLEFTIAFSVSRLRRIFDLGALCARMCPFRMVRVFRGFYAVSHRSYPRVLIVDD